MKKILLAIGLFSTVTFANPWVECGIGGAVATLFENKKAGSVVAVLSNVVWDLGTTATSSATSSPGTCANKPEKAARLINETYETLAAETAKGDGENLNALLEIVEIDSKMRTVFIEDLRSELAKSLAAPEYAGKSRAEKAESYYYGLVRVITKHS